MTAFPKSHRLPLPAALALAAVLVASGPAAAQNIRGTAAGAKVVGTGGADVMVAHQGGSRLFGMGGNDKMIGQRGRDQLFAGPGDDLVHGGHGNDVLSGGPGADLFRLFDNDGANQVIDFEAGDRLLIQKPAAVLYGYYSDGGFAIRNGRTTADVQLRDGDFSTSLLGLVLFGNIHGHNLLSLPVFTAGKGYREQFMRRPLTAAEQFDAHADRPCVITPDDIGEFVVPAERGCGQGFDFGPLTTGATRVLIEPVANGARGVDNATHGCPDCWMLYQANVWRVTKTAAGVVTKLDAKPVTLAGYDFMYTNTHFHRIRVHTEALFDLAAARRVLAKDKQDAQQLANWLASCGSNC